MGANSKRKDELMGVNNTNDEVEGRQGQERKVKEILQRLKISFQAHVSELDPFQGIKVDGREQIYAAADQNNYVWLFLQNHLCLDFLLIFIPQTVNSRNRVNTHLNQEGKKLTKNHRVELPARLENETSWVVPTFNNLLDNNLLADIPFEFRMNLIHQCVKRWQSKCVELFAWSYVIEFVLQIVINQVHCAMLDSHFFVALHFVRFWPHLISTGVSIFIAFEHGHAIIFNWIDLWPKCVVLQIQSDEI